MSLMRVPSPQILALFLLSVTAAGCGAHVDFVHPLPHQAAFAARSPHANYMFGSDVHSHFEMPGDEGIEPIGVSQFRDSLEAGFESTFTAPEQATLSESQQLHPDRPHVELLRVEPRLIERVTMHHGDARAHSEIACRVHYAMRLTVNGETRDVEETVTSEETSASVDGASHLLRSGLEVMFTHMRHTVIESLAAAGVAPPPTVD